jgi:hypothetical protein
VRIPDWLLYLGLLSGILWVTGKWHEVNNAPLPPSPPTSAEMALFANFTPFSTTTIMNLPSDSPSVMRGTAFSVSRTGQWLLMADTVAKCQNPFLNIGGGLAVALKIQPIKGHPNMVFGLTEGGSTPFTMANEDRIKPGLRAFVAGYSTNSVGEATGRLIGNTTISNKRRMQQPIPAMAWAASGRTLGLEESINRFAGGPALDDNGHAVGIMLKEKPRRGRIYTTRRETLVSILEQADYRPGADIKLNLTKRNYANIADSLRREYRIAQVGCIER